MPNCDCPDCALLAEARGLLAHINTIPDKDGLYPSRGIIEWWLAFRDAWLAKADPQGEPSPEPEKRIYGVDLVGGSMTMVSGIVHDDGSVTMDPCETIPVPAPEAAPATYPWGEGDLTGGRVTDAGGSTGVVIRREPPPCPGAPDAWIVKPDVDNPRSDWPCVLQEDLRPAPFTPANGQRVRQASNAASKRALDYTGEDGRITLNPSFADDDIEVQFDDGTILHLKRADLMLLADAPEEKPEPFRGDISTIATGAEVKINGEFIGYVTKCRRAKPAPTEINGFCVHQYGDQVYMDLGSESMLLDADLARALGRELIAYAGPTKPTPKPRWHKYTEAEQREMAVGTRLKIKGGPVITKATETWWNWVCLPPHGKSVDAHFVAQLKAREVKQ